ACNAGQPDWGTLLAAVGASGVDLHPELLDLYVGDLLLMLEGWPVSFDRNLIVQLFSSPEIDFTIDLHLGPGSATMWTCTWHGEFG
ncbi:MAG: bifunctional ornithine acetyltransferase/N-acetylglutamate synthase, partial [Chloroflexaceae bacterium]|nr:bifunctional ornithine acetyltransferase/N-acetylglutamate synthase [Chloroflexaceae bacterium]